MKGIIEEPLLHMVPKRFDYIGNVAIISVPAELEVYRRSGNVAPGISRWVFDLVKK